MASFSVQQSFMTPLLSRVNEKGVTDLQGEWRTRIKAAVQYIRQKLY